MALLPVFALIWTFGDDTSLEVIKCLILAKNEYVTLPPPTTTTTFQIGIRGSLSLRPSNDRFLFTSGAVLAHLKKAVS